MVTEVLVFADDLTGALEAGAKFAATGMQAAVATQPGDFDDPVVVVDTESRHLETHEAEQAIAEWAGRPAHLIYKKTDSTLRGNIGAELRALHRVYGGRIAYVPAYPALGRTVRDGCLYVGGVVVTETEFARDCLNPVRHAAVRSLLDSEIECVVFDGETDADVDQAAQLILDERSFDIVAGPAAIAEALAARLGTFVPPAWNPVRRCLVVNGSRSGVSARQIEEALAGGWISRDPGADWRLFEMEIPQGAEAACVALETGCGVRDKLSRGDFDGVIVFGGDTAFGVLRSLGLPVLRPKGEILPGVPVSSIEGRREVLITKAGGFGGADLLEQLRRKLNG